MKGARAIIPVLPSAMTLGNLVCGFMAMAKTVDAMTMSTSLGPLDPEFGNLILHASGLIFLGMVFDALDGRVARMAGASSSFGAQLDTLADVVTFGVTPALMAKVVYEHAKVGLDQPFMPKVVSALCALYVVCAALRLARFTVATDDAAESHEVFAGLPSPAAAGVVGSAVLFAFAGRLELPWSQATGDAVAITILRSLPWLAAALGMLMVSNVPYVHVAQRYLGRRARVPRFVKIVVGSFLVLIFHEWSFLLVILIYVGGGLVFALRQRITGRSPFAPSPTDGLSADEGLARDPVPPRDLGDSAPTSGSTHSNGGGSSASGRAGNGTRP